MILFFHQCYVTLSKLISSNTPLQTSSHEHGYFRSPGRGGKNQKIACLFFSIGRMNMRRRAFERSMLRGYQKIILVVIASFFTSLRLIKVTKVWKFSIHLRAKYKNQKYRNFNTFLIFYNFSTLLKMVFKWFQSTFSDKIKCVRDLGHHLKE